MNEELMLIEEIHQAFDTEQDRLFAFAEKAIADNVVKDVDYVRKMHDLGFVNSRPVIEAKERLETAMKNAELGQLIMHYRDNYPLLKFLTEESLDRICNKYNLIYAPVTRYIRGVPNKNVEEIFKAQVLTNEDTRAAEWKIKDGIKWYTNFPRKWRQPILDATYERTPSDSVIRQKFPEITTSMIYKERPECEKVDYEGLFIAAPKNHFDLTGLTPGKTKGYFQTVTKQMIQDPIVFRYVKGGVQVLTKWGLEANDPELANPLDN